MGDSPSIEAAIAAAEAKGEPIAQAAPAEVKAEPTADVEQADPAADDHQA